MDISDKQNFYSLVLSRKEQNLINSWGDSLHSFKSHIVLPRIVDELQLHQMGKLILENDPTLLGVEGFRFIFSPMTVIIQPLYCLSPQEIQALLSECNAQREKIINRIHLEDTYNKVLHIHDILSRNIKYVAGENPELHSIVGPLTKKTGVCEGYAKTLKYILDALSIPSIVIVGSGYNQLAQQEEPHAWNLVKIDGEWTHIDLTFDATIREHDVPRYDYFGLPNEEILKDHKYDVSLYPEAKSKGLSYYERNGQVMRKKSSLKSFLMESLQAGIKDIVFKLPNTASEANVEVQVTAEINSFLSQNNLYMGYMLYYNAKQRVFHAHLEE